MRAQFLRLFHFKQEKDGVISFTLPAKVSASDLLSETQKISKSINQIVAVYPPRLQAWNKQKIFTRRHSKDRVVRLQIKVKETPFKSRPEQKHHLKLLGIKTASIVDVACAHALYFVAQKKDLFDGSIIRVNQSKLYYGDGGLSQMDETDYINSCRYQIVHMAGSLTTD